MAVSVFLTAPKTAFAASYRSVSVEENYGYANQVLSQVNKQRAAKGLKALKMDGSLLQSAMFRAAELTVKFSHERPNGTMCFSAANGTMCAENIAMGQTSPTAVMNSWMNSTGHKANILMAEAQSIGIGCVKYGGTWYWVQCFGWDAGDGKTKSGTAKRTVQVSLTEGTQTKYAATKAKTAIKKIKLSTTAYTYSGKVKKPAVTVYDSKGRKVSSKSYTVAYSKGRKNVGRYTVKVTAKGSYTGTLKATFTIKPKGTGLSSLSGSSKGFTARWKKQTAQTTGYQIQYSTSSKFKSAKTVTVAKNKTTSKKITKLKAKKKYYVRVRTYKTVGKTKYYSAWSKAKAVTTKR